MAKKSRKFDDSAPPEVVPPSPSPSPPPEVAPPVVISPISSDWLLDGSAAADIVAAFGNKSKAIRALRENGMEFAAIAKALGVRYQMVRNVLDRPLKRLIKAQRAAANNGEQNAS